MALGRKSGDLSIVEVRALLGERLRARLPRAESVLLERLREVAGTSFPADPEYAAGVRAAAREAIDYAIAAMEAGERPTGTIPTAIAKQARRAARGRIPLESVFRRYQAGDRLLSEWITGAAEDMPVAALREIIRTQGRVFDHLTAAIADEYRQELEKLHQSPAQRQRQRIKALLHGDSCKPPSLTYNLDAWHIGMIVCGSRAEDLIGELAGRLDCQTLSVPATWEDCTWAWLGGRAEPDVAEIEEAFRAELPDEYRVALGEVHRGLSGWRLTHMEAQAAFQVAICRPNAVIRCRDVILEAAVMRDPLLVSSLIGTYLHPLDDRAGAGQVLRETLRVYFSSEQNAAAAAAALDVDRHTVRRRLRHVESRLGAKVDACAPQLQVALAVEELVKRPPSAAETMASAPATAQPGRYDRTDQGSSYG